MNPAHLFLGTAADNALDALRKGRLSMGERHPGARLTASDVIAIRAAYREGRKLQRELAEEYGVKLITISDLIRRRTWKGVP